jgi:hypothetical protein
MRKRIVRRLWKLAVRIGGPLDIEIGPPTYVSVIPTQLGKGTLSSRWTPEQTELCRQIALAPVADERK